MARKKKVNVIEVVETPEEVVETPEEVVEASEEVVETPEEVVEASEEVVETPEEVVEASEEVVEAKWRGLLHSITLSLSVTKVIKLVGESKTEFIVNTNTPNMFYHCILSNESVNEIKTKFKLPHDSFLNEIYENYSEEYLLKLFSEKGGVINRITYQKLIEILK